MSCRCDASWRPLDRPCKSAGDPCSLSGLVRQRPSCASVYCGPQRPTHFSSTSTLAPLATICVAVVRPPMPPPTMTASYSTSVGA